MLIKETNAEQAKSTGGMIALIPRQQDLELLVVDGGEPIKDLHCTVIYLGEDVRDQDPTELISHLDYVSGNYSALKAKAFGHALFNPKGDEPCAVYLIGDSPDITPLFSELKGFVIDRYPGAAEQHDPFAPHITAGYGLKLEELEYTGPIVFDKLVLRWPDNDQDWEL